MSKKGFIQQLNDRGVIRVAGLYIALTWLTLQIADVLFPAFDIPDSVLRYVVFAAAAGFPLVCLLSWFYEITDTGIVSEESLQEQNAPRVNKRGLTTTTIVLLVLALGTSLYVNFRLATDDVVTPPTLRNMLIADITNLTGDPLFDQSLESALAIGLEGAPFITAYSRNLARKIAIELDGSNTLTENAARLVSVREDIDLVLAGTIEPNGSGYTLTQRAVDPVSGDLVASASADADDKSGVLPAVGSLAAQVREALGDATLEDGNLAASETMTTTSLAAVQYYTQAQNLAFEERNEQAVELFAKAAEEDPEFGRVYSGWALSELKLGRRERSMELWEKALALISTTSERERFRTLGLYYAVVTRNQLRAIESYEQLVEKYPADTIGWNNLAVAYFFSRQFNKALEVGEELAQRLPDNPAFRTNYSLFAMYAGEFEVSRREAEAVLASNPDYFLAYLPVAMAASHAGDLDTAADNYAEMAKQNDRAASLANDGLADLALLRGDYAAAAELLNNVLPADEQAGNMQGALHKRLLRARALAGAQQHDAARAELAALGDATATLSLLLPQALLHVDLGENQRAEQIAADLAERLQAEDRAAAALMRGAIALAEQRLVDAVDALNTSITHADSWLARFYLGQAYSAAGYDAEALGEFERCLDRIGETTALFLDDVPSFNYSPAVHYWLGRSRQALGNIAEARNDYTYYLSLRVPEDQSPWTEDARQRLLTTAAATTP